MALDHRIAKARDHFGITKPEDWQEVRPEWITRVPKVGPRTLDLIRLYLAGRGLTLKDDGTVEFWQRNLQTASIGGQVALTDNAVTEAFTILIDSGEQQPWTFQGFKQGDKPLIIPIKFKSLGASRGDYSVAGCEGSVHVERKSVQDAIGTFLSHGERGERWQNELAYLASVPHGHVVIEGTIHQCVHSIEPRGTRSKKALAAEFVGSVMSWSDSRVPFWFIDSRRLAEDWTRRLLRRGWLYATEQKTKSTPFDSDAVIDSL